MAITSVTVLNNSHMNTLSVVSYQVALQIKTAQEISVLHFPPIQIPSTVLN